jgi:alcohol dehydrogenase
MAKALGKTDAKDPMDFVNSLIELQKACGVYELKMSDYGIKNNEFEKFAENAKYSMGNLFKFDPIELAHEDVVDIYRKSFR